MTLEAAPEIPMQPRTRKLLMAVRRALIMILCALDDYLELEHAYEKA